MCGKLWIEKGTNICECGGAPTEAVVRRTAITTTAAILYTRLPAGVLSEKGRPQGRRFVLSMWFVTVQAMS